MAESLSIRRVLDSFKDVKPHQVIYLLISLGVIYALQAEAINSLVLSWFSDGNRFSKWPLVWALALYLSVSVIDKEHFTKSDLSALDIVACLFAVFLITVLGSFYETLIFTFLFAAVIYFATHYQNISRVLIVWAILFYSVINLASLVPELQLLATIVVEKWLSFFGIPVLVREYSIAIPKGMFLVEEGCSGFKYLSNNLILAVLFGVLGKLNFRQLLLAVVITIIYSLLINWIRITIIIVVAHNWGFDVPFFVKDHANLGWVIYAIFLPFFFMTLIKIEDSQYLVREPSFMAGLNNRRFGVPRWVLLPFIFAVSLV